MASAAQAQSSGREPDRRKTILRAAIEVFARKGYHGCRISDVAREAKVAYGLVYHYFKNKEELLQSVFEVSWGAFTHRLREVAATPGTLEERLHGIADVAFEAYRVDPRAVKVLILEIARSPSGAGRAQRQSAFSEVIALTHQLFSEAQKKGELRKDADPLLCATMLFGAIEMSLTGFVVGLLDAKDPGALERAKQQIAENVLRGVLAGPVSESWKKDTSAIKLKTARRS